MNKAPLDSIVGSWLFVRSTNPEFQPGLVHHFTRDLKNITDIPVEGKRYRHSMPYTFSEGTLTLFPPEGDRKIFVLTPEDDGSVRISIDGDHTWWMRRLTPEEADSLGLDPTDGFSGEKGGTP